MNGVLYSALVGGTAAALWAAIIWIVRRIKNGPPPPEEQRGPPLTREQMVEHLRAVVDDPEAAATEREKAKARLEAFGRYGQSS